MGHFIMYHPFFVVILILFLSLSRLTCPATAAIITFGSGANEFDIEFVDIGNVGNLDDNTGIPSGVGKVDYGYRIAKHETSWDMVNKFNGSQDLTITLDNRDPDKPSTRIDWNEAARFVNWLNTSEGYQAAYRFDTDGIDDNLSVWDSNEAWQVGGENLFRHKNAKYWLPSVDEWYKAAYYDPNTSSYYDYPTLSGTIPTAVSGGTGANTAVYDQSLTSGPANVTEAGGLSAYGVMGLGGNAMEWNETSSDRTNSSGDLARIYRGGKWYSSSATHLGSSSAFEVSPTSGSYGMGFRVASSGISGDSSASNATVPEPNSLAIWSVVSIGVLRRRRRKKLRSRNGASHTPSVI